MPVPTFKTYLTELTNAPYPYHRWSASTYEWQFTTNAGDLYGVSFSRLPTDLPHRYTLQFFLQKPGTTASAKLRSQHPVPTTDPTRTDAFFDPYGITGTGDALRILATVMAILKTFIATAHPTRIDFSASEPSRQKLYRMFIRQVSRYLPSGWTGHENLDGARGEYSLVRKS